MSELTLIETVKEYQSATIASIKRQCEINVEMALIDYGLYVRKQVSMGRRFLNGSDYYEVVYKNKTDKQN